MTVWRGSLFFQLATHSGVGCQSSAALLEVLEVRLSNFLIQENLCYVRVAGASLFYNIYIRFLLFLFRNTILKDNLSFYYCNLCTCISKPILNSCFHLDFDVKVTAKSRMYCVENKLTSVLVAGLHSAGMSQDCLLIHWNVWDKITIIHADGVHDSILFKGTVQQTGSFDRSSFKREAQRTTRSAIYRYQLRKRSISLRK